MREIKFRAWDNENLCMVERPFVVSNEGKVFNEYHSGGYTKPYELMQYTGLKDKNGKEIYEGDIIRVHDMERGCICGEWEDCDGQGDEHKEHGEHKHDPMEGCDNYLCTQTVKWACGYFCDEDTGDFCPPLSNEELELEVIGNIYENPELLTNT